MKTIAKIIFDTLAAAGGVNLPDVGSLCVERDAAKFVSKSEIRPPHNRVVFSRKQNPAFQSIVDLMVAAGEARKDAEKKYAEWLEKSRGEKGLLEINDVGVLKHDFFYPSAALHDTLNPDGQKSVRLQKSNNAWRKVAIVAVYVVGAAVLVFFGISLARFINSRKEVRTEQVVAREKRAAARGESTIAVTTPSAKDKNGQTEDAIQRGLEEYATAVDSPTNPRLDSETAKTENVAPVNEKISCWEKFKNIFRCKKDKTPAPVAEPVVERVIVPVETVVEQPEVNEPVVAETRTVPMYHVVAGVFVHPENAEKLIANDHLQIGRKAYTTMPYKGKTMVVAFSSTNRGAAVRKWNELLPFDYELWVWEEK